jgi:hypothetical protein
VFRACCPQAQVSLTRSVTVTVLVWPAPKSPMAQAMCDGFAAAAQEASLALTNSKVVGSNLSLMTTLRAASWPVVRCSPG